VENAAPVKIFFAGENNGAKTALDLAAQAGTITLVSDMAQADALVLDEADEASRMTGFLRPVVNFIFIAPSRLGAKISPPHNRFPITMRPAALAEAQSLTEERVKLVNG